MDSNLKIERDEEVTLYEVGRFVKSYLATARSNWYWIVFGGLALGVWMGYEALKKHDKYRASLTFVINEEVGGSTGGLGNILGSFGLGGGSNAGFSVDRVLSLAGSQKIALSVLLDSFNLDGSSDILVNHILNTYALSEVWKLTGVTRVSSTELGNMTIPERKLVKDVYKFVYDEDYPLVRTSVEELSGILEIEAITQSEDVSLVLVNEIYNRLNRFYTNESTGGSKASVRRLEGKADSLAIALKSKEYALATSVDTRLGLIQRRDQVRQTQLEREVGILSLAYAEVLKNLETARFLLNGKSAVFQTVDEPFEPLDKLKPAPFIQGLIGFGLGAMGIFVIVAIRKFIKDLGDEKSELDLQNANFNKVKQVQ